MQWPVVDAGNTWTGGPNIFLGVVVVVEGEVEVEDVPIEVEEEAVGVVVIVVAVVMTMLEGLFGPCMGTAFRVSDMLQHVG